MWHKKDSFSREGLIEWVLPRLIERVLLMSQSTYTHPKMMTVAPSAMFLVWMSHIVLYIHRSEGGYSCMNVSYLWVLLMSTKWRTRSMSHVVLYIHCNTLQHTATHCNTLQHTATHCNTLQHQWVMSSSTCTDPKEIIVVLTWATKPKDLDLWVITDDGQVIPYKMSIQKVDRWINTL